MKHNNNKGFTLVEIMIVVAIIGLLAAIAIPNFVKARKSAQTNACVNNLRLMSGAIDQWALENKKADGSDVTMDDLKPYLKGNMAPVCPTGNAYTFDTVGTAFPVSCANSDHDNAFQSK